MHRHFRVAAMAGLAALAACASDPVGTTPTDNLLEARGDAREMTLAKIGTFAGGGAGAAEITAYDATTKRLFVVNGAQGTVDVLDLANPALPVRLSTISVAGFGAGVNSVSAHDGLVALAVEATDKQAPGVIAFYDAATLAPRERVPAGALPDMVTFTPNGRYVLAANEGEPSADYTNDPEGSVTIIELEDAAEGDLPRVKDVKTADFRRFIGQEDALRRRGIRIFGPGANAAQDLEPEYIATDKNAKTAWVTLQENNAVAVIDIAAGVVRELQPLGYKNHALPGNGLDPSDRDNVNSIRTWPVLGMYQPDAIAAFDVQGRTFLITANEGDAREYAAFAEESRVSQLGAPLGSAFTTAACYGLACTNNAALGRLNVTRTLGRTAAGTYDTLFAFGARSVSIRTAEGALVWDSGDDLERRTLNLPNVNFNASNTADQNARDDRSDNKGPEPEGVVVGKIRGREYAFVGLERVGGIIVYDVTVPSAPRFMTYLNTRTGGTGDLGPEGVAFISEDESPNGQPLLVVGHEVSGTTTVLQISVK